MASREDEFDEVPYDRLADRGQYRAFQRAYGKENQAMLTLIVMTVAWSYAAHVYGHDTVFVWFTRTLLTVVACFLLFHLLKFFHQHFENAVIKISGTKGNPAPQQTPKPLEKKKPKRSKRSKPPSDKGSATGYVSAADDGTPVSSNEELTTAQPKPPPSEPKHPKKQSTTEPKQTKKPRQKTASAPAPAPAPRKKAREQPDPQTKTDAQIAAETAVEQAKTEARVATQRLEQAKQAEAIAMAQSASSSKKGKLLKQKQQPKQQQTSNEPEIPVALPAPRSKNLQRAGSTDSSDMSPASSPDSGNKRSYVPPHLREGYKGKGAKQAPTQPRTPKSTTRQRGRRGSDKNRKDEQSMTPPRSPTNQTDRESKDDLMQQSMYVCLDLDSPDDKAAA